jgi:hypothetical protein
MCVQGKSRTMDRDCLQCHRRNRSMIVKSFKVCGISNDLFGAEKDLIWCDVNVASLFDSDDDDDKFD